MPLQSAEMDHASLGEYLRETRINLGLHLETVAEETKVPPKSLQAIEENNFNALPAEAFARGFYVLYAKKLELDPEDILQMYMKERPNQNRSRNRAIPAPSRMAEEVNTMAERPSFMPFSFFGLVLLLLFLFGGFLCWYFSWNPATYLSQKLRSLEQNPRGFEQVLESRLGSSQKESIFDVAQVQTSRKNMPRNLFNLSSPSTARAAMVQPTTHQNVPAISAQTAAYTLHAEFREETKLTLALDDLPERTLSFTPGDSITWRAKEKVVITLPGTTRTRVSLNDVPMRLPEQHQGSITISLPEHNSLQ
ncbi:MAG: helix-turn-helix domain-containing protein [Desulforhopalus sp.]